MQPAGTRDARQPAGASRAAVTGVNVRFRFAFGCPGVRRACELVRIELDALTAQFLQRSRGANAALGCVRVCHDNHLVRMRKDHFSVVRHQHLHLVLHRISEDALLQQCRADVSVKRRERVVHNDERGVRVDLSLIHI